MSDEKIVLEPCPWCDTIPEIYECETAFDTTKRYSISCRGSDCDIEPMAAVACDTEIEIAVIWNSYKMKGR